MRLKLLSPGEMSADQKETYDESIAGKRGAPPAPMMAWLNSPEMARHATRLGGVLLFDTIFPAKLSEIAILVTARHWTSHYEWFAHKRLALKGGMDPKIIDDIRDRRTPVFDDPKGQMIYDISKSLHEGHGVSQALYEHYTFAEDGTPLTGNLVGYAFPSPAELPSWESIFMETPTPANPLGAKGIGESGTIGSTPAVYNAVIDALSHYGVKHVAMPANGENVWRALQEAKA